MNRIEEYLKLFNLDQFRDGQYEIIENICNNKDVFVQLATGAGKSLCYQLSGIIKDGITIVISPMISLQKDQVESLIKLDIPAICLNSELSNDELFEIQQNINNYTSLYDYQMYLGGIINERINLLERIKNKINTYKQNIFTDNRKNSYLSSNLEFYKNIHFYIFILYYAIFIVFLIFSNFIKDKLYENKYVMIYVLIILIIPFILRYILLNIYNLYISYIERNYLKLDEISYKYLVEETDQQINNKKDKQQLDNYHARRNGN